MIDNMQELLIGDLVILTFIKKYKILFDIVQHQDTPLLALDPKENL